MDLTSTFEQLGIALGLGLLVGLQRERTDSRLAGIRTFPLITTLGTICALLSQPFGGWIVASGLIALAGMILTGKMVEIKEEPRDPGLTSEIAMLLMFGVGAYLVIGSKEVAIVIGGGTAVLLQFKGQLHGIAGKLGENDLKAIMQFVLISFVILPILPDRTFGPYAVLNPRQTWWMVVLIVGINLGGYITYKFMGKRAGIVLGGILGGAVSSTATTVSYARRTTETPGTSRVAAIVVMIASTVVFARLLLIIAMVAAPSLPVAAPPILLVLIILSVLSGWVWFAGRDDEHEMPVQQNPSELRSALAFGLLYALVVFAVAAVKEHFGSSGLYVVAGFSGLVDLDAITLSTFHLVSAARLSAEEGWRLILVASMANLVFKALTIAALGRRDLLLKIAPLFGLGLASCVLVLRLWGR